MNLSIYIYIHIFQFIYAQKLVGYTWSLLIANMFAQHMNNTQTQTRFHQRTADSINTINLRIPRQSSLHLFLLSEPGAGKALRQISGEIGEGVLASGSARGLDCRCLFRRWLTTIPAAREEVR